MEHSYRFFENKNCRYYPCHNGLKDLNCLFCYCPLYSMENCPGAPSYRQTKQGKQKLCENCNFPHQPENYDKIIRILERV